MLDSAQEVLETLSEILIVSVSNSVSKSYFHAWLIKSLTIARRGVWARSGGWERGYFRKREVLDLQCNIVSSSLTSGLPDCGRVLRRETVDKRALPAGCERLHEMEAHISGGNPSRVQKEKYEYYI